MILDHGVRHLTGFVASLLFSMLTGLVLSFNVYAVALKRTFGFSQTQVELIGSFATGGAGTSVVGVFIINRYGHRACYVFSWVMITSSCLLMWLTTQHVDFFRNCIPLLCFFQLLVIIGMSNAQNCLIAIGILKCQKKHTGRTIGLYTAFTCLGKIYYSASFKIFFQSDDGLGRFFLFVPVGVSIMSVLCFLLHTAPEVDQECRELLPNSLDEHEMDDIQTCDNKSGKQNDSDQEYPAISQILRSSFLHLVVWPNLWFQSCGLSFMNNVTSIASSLTTAQPEVTIYILALGIIISRVSSGFIFDRYKTNLAGLVLFQICSICFGSAMFLGLIWLNDVSIYIITSLASVAVGALYSLTLILLTLLCGPSRFMLVSTCYTFGLTCFTFIIQVFMGMTYDHAYQILKPTTFLCAECFHWAFLILMCSALLYFIVQCCNIFITIRQK